MISGECPHCDQSWLWGWDEKQRGHYVVLCHDCRKPFWIEFAEFGVTRDHDAFVRDVATPDGRKDEAEAIMRKRVDDGISITEERAE